MSESTDKIDVKKIKMGVQVLLDPAIIKAERNSRCNRIPLDEDEIEKKYLSYRSNNNQGQLTPVSVRIVGNDICLVFGFYRHAAALLYNARHSDKPMKLKCIATNCNSEEALVRSIEENRVRRDTSPIDDAHAQRELRENHGWTDIRIAEQFQVAASVVCRLAKLLLLEWPIQLRVHQGELSVDAAIKLAALPEQDRAEIMAEALTVPEPEGQADEPESTSGHESNGKAHRTETVSQRVKAATRERAIEQGGKQPRTLAETKKFLGELAQESDDQVANLCKVMLRYIAGEITDKTAAKKLAELTKS